MNGWVMIHRQIQGHWIWKDPIKLKWWLDILLTVNSAPAKVNLGYHVLDCNRGESLLSIQGWATRWNVSKDKARNFLKLLEKQNMIVCVSHTKTTRLTVCNYDSYQSSLHVDYTQSKRNPNATTTQTRRSNKDKKEKKEFIPPQLQEVLEYFAENSFPEWLARKAHNHYATANWTNSKGKPVENWKRTMSNNWFEEQYKIKEPAPKKEYSSWQ